MKILKTIFYSICALLLLLCLSISILAFHPELNIKLAAFLYGKDQTSLQAENTQDYPEEALLTDSGNDGNDGNDENTAAPGTGGNSGSTAAPGNGGNDESTAAPGNGGNSGSTAAPGNGTNNGNSGSSNIQVNLANVPNEVNGRNGYRPVQENLQELEEEEARLLLGNKDYGNTGEGLTFDETYYPYYAMLNAVSQSLYRQIYSNALNAYSTFTPIADVNISEMKKIYAAVYNDHPELFWLNPIYSCKYERGGKCVEIQLQFYSLVNQLSEAKSLFEKSALAILSGIPENATDFEKELYIHDTLIQQVEYDLSADMHQSAYSALVNGNTVCAGYARAFQYLMQKAGIPCYYCTGYAGEDHAWNIVLLDGEYYNVDSTWNDTDPNTYDFFNKTDGEMSSTHLRKDLSVNLPACNGQAYRYTPENSGNSVKPTLRSLSDTDFGEEDALDNLEDYYYECYHHLIQEGPGVVTFYSVIPSSLWQSVYDSYITDAYLDGYLNSALTDLNASSCSINLQGEELQGGWFLLSHVVAIQ